MTRTYRRLLKTSRIAHVYLTLFGLVLILFFGLTGFVLNHEDWFLPAEPYTRTEAGDIPTAALNPVDKFEVAEALRRRFAVPGAVNSFRADEDSAEVEFLRPGGRAVAEVRRDTGRAVVTYESRGWVGVLADLHKGKSAGRAWGLVIDGVCVLLLVISATGLVLWSSLKSRGKWGAAAVLGGGLIAAGVYYWCVP